MGVIIPPMLAPYAMARIKRTLSCISEVRNEAMGISKSAEVVLDKKELSMAAVVAREKMMPLGVEGKTLRIFVEINSCKWVFSVATAKINPPKKR